MAESLFRRAYIFILFIFVFNLNNIGADNIYSNPEFQSLSVINVKNNADSKEIEFEVHGRNIYKGMEIKATKENAFRNTKCGEDLNYYSISEIRTNISEARYALRIPQSIQGNIYLCLPHVVNNAYFASASYLKGDWFHQGENVTLNLNNYKLSDTSDLKESFPRLNTEIPQFSNINTIRNRRNEATDESTHRVLRSAVKITGLRVDSKDASIGELGVPELYAKARYTIRLFGTGFNERTLVTFTEHKGQFGSGCPLAAGGIFPVKIQVINGDLNTQTAEAVITLPTLTTSEAFYICATEGNVTELTNISDSLSFVHQGSEPWLRVKSIEPLLPLWASIIVILICLAFSALFSGLNLGLMALDRTELQILCNTGTLKERKYAKIIQPVRNHGNYLLCSILLGNVFVNSIFTILLDGLTSGLVAVIFSTLAIVMIGEITPQAFCSRHGLAVGANTIYITKMIMLLTAPLAYPVSKILDFVLGEEIGNVYNRERLKELVKMTTGVNDLDKDEVNIISGALELRKKTVAEVMTKIEDIFMLDYDAVLDFETVSEIMKSGYSRIPVYKDSRTNIVTMLYIKDLAFVDPDDNTPLKTLCQFYQNHCNFVFEDVTLDYMFKQFKEGNKGHMAFVHRVNSDGDGDPFYETTGLITLEDVIEELIQAEIVDETDVITDNRTKRRRNANRTKQDFTIFAEKRSDNKLQISPQLTLATYQYLSTSIAPFRPDAISETVLRRLLKQEIFFHVKKTKEWRIESSTLIYQNGKPTDYFVLILEGRVEVTVGRENLMFESGPFTYFGVQALSQTISIVDSGTTQSQSQSQSKGSTVSLDMDASLRYTFLPDYSVRACTEVFYLKIRRNLYMAAKRATLMERVQKDSLSTTPADQFEDEVEKYFDELAYIFQQYTEYPSNYPIPWRWLLHTADEECNTADRNARKSENQIQEANSVSPLSQNNPKSTSPHSIFNRTSPIHINGTGDTNKGALKKLSLVPNTDDAVYMVRDVVANEEGVSLLPKK